MHQAINGVESMTVVCECGEKYALVYRNDVDMREGTIKKCKVCKNDRN